MVKKRIEYIDAMRGFTMILVVYSHVCHYCLGDRWMGWNDVFFLFRLPCFFFISGWLFEPVRDTIRAVVKKKFMVQIIPTVIFLLLLAPPPLFFSRLGATKGGYWFTFALFEFFLLYLFSGRLFKRWSGAFALVVSIAAFCYDVYYARFEPSSLNFHCSLFTIHFSLSDILGFLSFITWRYYLFFYIGTWVKRHFEEFIHWTSKPAVIMAVVVGFALMAWHPHSEHKAVAYLIFAVGGVLGLTMIFTIFRFLYTNSHLSSLTSHLSPLKYIGTRTLDIYLLHYFFLPRFLLDYAPQLQSYDSSLLEFAVALLIALIVVAVCLLVSYVIRLSPFLGHWLFGVSMPNRPKNV